MSVEEVLCRVPVAKPELRSAVQEEGLVQVTSVVVTPVAVVCPLDLSCLPRAVTRHGLLRHVLPQLLGLLPQRTVTLRQGQSCKYMAMNDTLRQGQNYISTWQ